MMKNIWQKVQSVLAIVCIAVYVCSALYAIIRVYSECQWQNKLAEREYTDLKDFASSASVLGFSSPEFKKDIEDAIALSRTLQAVIIIGPRNAALVAEKVPDLVHWDGSYPRFSGGINLLKRLQPAPLSIKGSNVTISVMASTIDFDVLLAILRPAFAGVLVAFIISFFMLMTEFYLQKNPAESSDTQAQAETQVAAEPFAEDHFGDFDDEPTFADDLRPALEEAEENSEDLCLLSASWTSEEAPLNILAGAAVLYFKPGTRVFEKEAPGIYAIIPDERIGEGLESAKEFHREAVAKLPKGIDTRLLIGLSSRAGRRDLDADRLIYETDSALLKAREDKHQPIVAFKVDLKKYKEFIAKHVDHT
ncbi:MAG: hypothetical protein LBT01_01945 [Spirochaetaceae bacterium]|jgi:hypothetical protein|nr:hypothetical protein [Spirochaetaceae bacterium]